MALLIYIFPDINNTPTGMFYPGAHHIGLRMVFGSHRGVFYGLNRICQEVFLMDIKARLQTLLTGKGRTSP